MALEELRHSPHSLAPHMEQPLSMEHKMELDYMRELDYRQLWELHILESLERHGHPGTSQFQH